MEIKKERTNRGLKSTGSGLKKKRKNRWLSSTGWGLKKREQIED